jgi:hypothetical protein
VVTVGERLFEGAAFLNRQASQQESFNEEEDGLSTASTKVISQITPEKAKEATEGLRKSRRITKKKTKGANSEKNKKMTAESTNEQKKKTKKIKKNMKKKQKKTTDNMGTKGAGEEVRSKNFVPTITKPVPTQ